MIKRKKISHNFTTYSWLLMGALLLMPFYTNAQKVEINCCGIKQTIPIFREDSIFSFNKQLPVEKKILAPITKSEAEIEIRVYRYVLPISSLIVIKSLKDSIIIEHYRLVMYSPKTNKEISPPSNTSYTDLGIGPGKLGFLIKKIDPMINQKLVNWNQIFKDLIESHFFDISSTKEIDAKLAQKIQDDITNWDISTTVYEIKIGNHFRNSITMGLNTVENKRQTSKDLKYNIQLHNIFDKIN